jgi:hypothetical protein
VAISYQQIDPTTDTIDFSNCSGNAIMTLASAWYTAAGYPSASTAGTTINTATVAASSTQVVLGTQIIQFGDTMTAGTWTFRLNVTTANNSLSITQVDLCYIDRGLGVLLRTVGRASVSVSLGTTGVKTITVTQTETVSAHSMNGMGTAATAAQAIPPSGDDSAYMGRAIAVIVSVHNSSASNQSFSYRLDQLIDTPFTAAINFQQTDTAGSATGAPWCSPLSLGSTFVPLAATSGGTAGTATQLPKAAAGDSAFFAWVITPASGTFWNGGPWVLPVHTVTANANLGLPTGGNPAPVICRVDSAMNLQETLSVGNPAHGGGGTASPPATMYTSVGITTFAVDAKPPTQVNPGDKVVIVYAAGNSSMSGQTLGIKADQLILSPFSSTVDTSESIPTYRVITTQSSMRSALW